MDLLNGKLTDTLKLAGKAVAESVDPKVEDKYWRTEYPQRKYYDASVSYDEVGPAYRYGWESRAEQQDRNWDDAEVELERGWTTRRGESSLGWDRARQPTRDAWERVASRQSLAQQDRQTTQMDRGQTEQPRLPK